MIALDTKESNKIIGYIELDPAKTGTKRYKRIRGIFVLPDYRRRGIGRTMLRLLLKHTIEEGVQLRIDAFTEEGRKFWQAYDFKIHHYSLYLDN